MNSYEPIEDVTVLCNALLGAVVRGGSEDFVQYTYELDSALIAVGHFSAEAFDCLLAIVRRSEFHELQASWQLLKVFYDNWEYLTEQQRSELLEALEVSFGYYKDWMSCFVITEILGELYADDRALRTLRRLRNERSDVARSMVPHGLEHIAIGSTDRGLARRAFAELVDMRTDEAASVRDEVGQSLGRLRQEEND